MKLYEVSAMTPATVDLSQVDSTVRAQVLQTLSASGLSEQLFLGHLYRLFAQGQFGLLDLLGPNAETLAAIQELEEGRGVISASVDDLFADLHAND
jgi:antitoxin component of RelBE/YafQ-DinJ toxin-antitoxin module